MSYGAETRATAVYGHLDGEMYCVACDTHNKTPLPTATVNGEEVSLSWVTTEPTRVSVKNPPKFIDVGEGKRVPLVGVISLENPHLPTHRSRSNC